jgi:hypothetical protein
LLSMYTRYYQQAYCGKQPLPLYWEHKKGGDLLLLKII